MGSPKYMETTHDHQRSTHFTITEMAFQFRVLYVEFHRQQINRGSYMSAYLLLNLKCNGKQLSYLTWNRWNSLFPAEHTVGVLPPQHLF